MAKLCEAPATTPEGHNTAGLSSGILPVGSGGSDGNLDVNGNDDAYRGRRVGTGTAGTSGELSGYGAVAVDEAITPHLLLDGMATATATAPPLPPLGDSVSSVAGGAMMAITSPGFVGRGKQNGGGVEAHGAKSTQGEGERQDDGEVGRVRIAAAPLVAAAVVDETPEPTPTIALAPGVQAHGSSVPTVASGNDSGVGVSGRKKTGRSRGGRRRRRGTGGAGSEGSGGEAGRRGQNQRAGQSQVAVGTGDTLESSGGADVAGGDMNEDQVGVFGAGDVVADGRADDVPEEDDEGNVEYKLKLVNPPLDRLEHLFTQMNWRLNEGRGECVYMVGYEDDGKATGVPPYDLNASIKTLKVMMQAVGAKISKMEVQAGAGGGKLRVARVTVVRQAAVLDGLPAGSARRGLRIGVLGHGGAGKSTLVGVLTRGLSDNGRGLARMQVFRHNHEIFNGQTSSISQQALTLPLARRGTAARSGRRSAGTSRTVTGGGAVGGGSSSPNPRRKHGGGDVASEVEAFRLSSSLPRSTRLGGASASNGFASAWARGRRRGDSLDESGGRAPRWAGSTSADDDEESRVLTFIDQPGHEKYLKTTLTGMTGSALDYAMLVVSGIAGVQRMTREHLAIALALQLPLFVVMTKTDVAGTLTPGISPPRAPPPKPAAASLLPSAAIELALQGLDRVLWSSIGMRAKIVGGVEEAEAAADAIRGGSGAAGTSWDGVVPIIQVSSVTANGYTELRAFLGRLAPPEPLEAMYKEARGKAAEVRISDTFMVEGAGEVYAGTVVSGTVSVGDRLLLGPTGPKGSFVRTAVASVHVSRLAVRSASAGQTASFTLVADLDGHGESDDSEPDSALMAPPMLTPAASAPTPSGLLENQVADPLANGNGPEGFGVGGNNSGDGGAGAGIEDKENDVRQNFDSSEPPAGSPPLGLGEPSPSPGSMAHGGGSGKASEPEAVGEGGVQASHSSPLLLEGGATIGEGESPGRRLRKGMVLVEAKSRPNTTYEFEAEVMILHHPRVIRENYQPVVHAHNICQSARIISMVRSSPANSATSEEGDDGCSTGIKSGERAVCRFRFLYRPEYLAAGTTIVLREGRTRGFGKVISVE